VKLVQGIVMQSLFSSGPYDGLPGCKMAESQTGWPGGR